MAIVVDDGGSPGYPDYLSFTSSGNSTISMQNTGGNAPVVYYSFDRETWTLWDYSAISLTDGQTVYMYGDNGGNGGQFSVSNTIYSKFNITGSIAAGGNIMSLLGEDFANYTAVGEFCFVNIFRDKPLLKSPKFPATILNRNCYLGALMGTSITESPYIPASPIEAGCYTYFLRNCTNLSRIVFGGDSWNTANATNWVDGVPATGTFVCPASLTIPVGTNGIPSGWTREDL